MEGLYQEYRTTNMQRVEYLGEMHQKLVSELQERDLKDVRTDKLLDMAIKTSDKLEEIKSSKDLRFRTKEDIEEQKEKDIAYENSMLNISLF